MHYCTACQKAIATIVIMDLSEGAVTGSQHVCPACAEQMGIGAPKAPKYAPELLEDLLSAKTGRSRGKPQEVCPGCGMTPADFRSKGRLGCPRCYDTFRGELMPLLQRIHESQLHRGRLPAVLPEAPTQTDQRTLSEVRRRLEEAVRGERYEEAARLRDELRKLERGDAT
jgi:protein arginine kinase activator